jgi:hypothetical protein
MSTKGKGTTQAEWLDRADIDSVLSQLSADDVIEVLAQDLPSVKIPMAIFNRAAARLGVSNGTAASIHLRVTEMKYLNEAVGAALDMNGPKASATEISQDSAATGE